MQTLVCRGHYTHTQAITHTRGPLHTQALPHTLTLSQAHTLSKTDRHVNRRKCTYSPYICTGRRTGTHFYTLIDTFLMFRSQRCMRTCAHQHLHTYMQTRLGTNTHALTQEASCARAHMSTLYTHMNAHLHVLHTAIRAHSCITHCYSHS